MNEELRKLEQRLVRAIESEKPQINAAFADALEAKLLDKFKALQAQHNNFLDSFINIFHRRAFAYVTAFVVVIFTTYILFPFGPRSFSPEGFLNQAYAHYETEQEQLRKNGDIHYNKVISHNGPDLASYVFDTTGTELGLQFMKEGANEIITETWSDELGNYLTTSIYSDTGLSLGTFLRTADGAQYTDTASDFIGGCIDTEDSDLEISTEDQEYYQEFGNLYGGSAQDRGAILESLLENDNVNYQGTEKIDGTTHRVFTFNQPLPAEFDSEGFESITWLYFTDDFELTRQDTGIKLAGVSYRLQSAIFADEDYIADDQLFLPETHDLEKSAGC